MPSVTSSTPATVRSRKRSDSVPSADAIDELVPSKVNSVASAIEFNTGIKTVPSYVEVLA